jgi:DNA repair protein RecO (recombination protein O)
MTQATWVPGQPWLTGRALMCGLYLNELVMKLLPREDSHPLLFESYAATLMTLAESEEHSAILREFETQLLAELGYGLQLERDVKTGAALQSDTLYRYDPLAGPMQHGGGVLVSGRVLLALNKGVFEDAMIAAEARDFVRTIIQFHLERRSLKSSHVMHDLHTLSERLDAKPAAQRKAKRAMIVEISTDEAAAS